VVLVNAPGTANQALSFLDQLVVRLSGNHHEHEAVQDGLRALLKANQEVIGALDLPTALRSIVEAARELVQARYGALGVISPTGGLQQFVHTGIDPETAKLIGHLPEGKGLLGALIDDPRPIRLTTLGADARSAGFPANHPPMTSFLGVPIRIRDEVFGNLHLFYLAWGLFRPVDEPLATALAATAAVAIDHARAYAESTRRQQWLEASTEITQQLLAAAGEEPLRLIARSVRRIADADVVTVVLPTADERRLMVEVATGVENDDRGINASKLTGVSYPIQNSLAGLAIETGRPVLLGDVAEQTQFVVHLTRTVPVGPVMVLPLVASSRTRGALMVGRLRGRHRFTDGDMNMATTFANHAAVALELSDARVDQQRVVLLEDRDRIARDMHDHVIQQLFATGLTVQSVQSRVQDEEQAARLADVVSDLDETIRQIRRSIFELRGPIAGTASVRTRLLAVIAELSPMLGFEPEARMSGPIDVMVAESVIDDVVAVLREALTNVARHARAASVEVDITATGSELVIDVLDDGVGLPESGRESGLLNLRYRAERHGGSLVLTAPDAKGTHLRWIIPTK
jgi:signal transduction histidine kinase